MVSWFSRNCVFRRLPHIYFVIASHLIHLCYVCVYISNLSMIILIPSIKIYLVILKLIQERRSFFFFFLINNRIVLIKIPRYTGGVHG